MTCGVPPRAAVDSCSRDHRIAVTRLPGLTEVPEAKVLPGPSLEGDGEPEVILAWAVPTKSPGYRYPGVSGAVKG